MPDPYEQKSQRRLAAIMAADVAGYSGLMSVDEEGTLLRLRRLRREVATVSGSIELDDGSREPITRGTLIAGNEAALRAFALGMVALAIALVVLRVR